MCTLVDIDIPKCRSDLGHCNTELLITPDCNECQNGYALN